MLNSEEKFKEELDVKLGPSIRVFQLFSASMGYYNSNSCDLYGYIRSDCVNESDCVCLFERPHDNCQTLFDTGLLSLTDPHPCRSVSAATTIKIVTDLFLHVYHKKPYKYNYDMICIEPSKENNDFQSKTYGSLTMNYIILDNPVEAIVGAWFKSQDYGPMERVYGKIIAYYGDIEKYVRIDEKSRSSKGRIYKFRRDEGDFYKATLFEASKSIDVAPLLETGKKIPLRRSMLATPEGGSLVIEAHLFSWDDDKEILGGTFEFPTERKDSSTGSIEGTCCSIDLKVNWKYEVVTGDV